MSTLKVNKIIPTAGVPTGGGGGIIQVVQETKTDVSTHSVNINAGFASYSLLMSKSITPKFSSSKIYIMWSMSGGPDANGCHVDFVIRKTVGSTVTHPILGDSASGYYQVTTGFRSGGGNQHNICQANYTFLDDAGTSSAITYGVAVATEGATTYRLNTTGSDNSGSTWSSRQASTLTLMEVSA
tara:strand:- start:2475 stop:3026 length:552 start_codon:yes stop_codon:yes gene_type:complete